MTTMNERLEARCTIEGKDFKIETGAVARQADGAVLVSFGETMVLVTATASKTIREGIDFFPLVVDYQEMAYAAGKIPGGFFKREGRPSEKEILTSRLDRSTPAPPVFPRVSSTRCRSSPRCFRWIKSTIRMSWPSAAHPRPWRFPISLSTGRWPRSAWEKSTEAGSVIPPIASFRRAMLTWLWPGVEKPSSWWKGEETRSPKMSFWKPSSSATDRSNPSWVCKRS